MNLRPIATSIAVLTLGFSVAFAADDNNPIKKSMDYTHKAPKGEKKISEKIIDGTATEEEVKKSLELYKAAADAKPPKGEQSAYKDKMNKLIAATEEVAAKKDGAAGHYKEAVNCKACHSEHKENH